MKYLIKDTLRPIYHYATNKYHTRDIYAIFDKLGGAERYKEKRNIKFMDLVFDIPDNLSFIYQIKEIFGDEIYKFDTKKQKPTIIDCKHALFQKTIQRCRNLCI